MIANIILTNFKGFQQVEIHPKRITVFVGPNGTGKSSVLQAFALLKQIEADDGLNHTNGFALPGPLVNRPDAAAAAALTFNGGGGNTVFQFRGGEAGSERDDAYDYCVEFANGNTPGALTVNASGRCPFLKNLKIVPALRGFTQPAYKLGEDGVKDVTRQPGLAQQAAQAATNLGYAPEQLEQVSRLLKEVTGVGLKAAIVPPQSVELRSVSPTGSINILAEGFGTNSLIMLLLQLVAAEPGATVLIEEPEIHLHPKAQADLAEVLVKEALAGDKQVIMATHSELITGRLLTLVAERTLTPGDLAIYAFAKDGETGVCTAEPLKISDEGGVAGGIRDFFATNLAEMNRYVEAQFARLNSSE